MSLLSKYSLALWAGTSAVHSGVAAACSVTAGDVDGATAVAAASPSEQNKGCLLSSHAANLSHPSQRLSPSLSGLPTRGTCAVRISTRPRRCRPYLRTR